MEELKTVVAWALSPLIMAMLLLLAGWGIVAFKGRWRFSLIAWGAGLLILLAGSLPVLSYERNRAREHAYAPLDPSGLDHTRPLAIIVLGTGFNPDPWLPANSQVSGGFHARFLEGVRIYRCHPGARLLVSVANPKASREEKERFLEGMIELVALDPESVALISEAECTDDEARLTRALVRDGEQVVIATSASHIPRAMAIFTTVGFDPVAAPCEFWHARPGSSGDTVWRKWIPSVGGVDATQQMLYETVASWWEKLKG